MHFGVLGFINNLTNMKIISTLVLVISFIVCAKAQEIDKRPSIVLNSGLGTTGISFNYQTSTDPNAVFHTFDIGAYSPYVANPGIRFNTKKGFSEIGFKNINVVSTSSTITDNNGNILANTPTQFFSSSIYYNRSFQLIEKNGSSWFVGVEPIANYYFAGGSADQENYLFSGREINFQLNFNARIRSELGEFAYVEAIGGASPVKLGTASTVQRFTDAENPIQTSVSGFKTGIWSYLQLTFGIRI